MTQTWLEPPIRRLEREGFRVRVRQAAEAADEEELVRFAAGAQALVTLLTDRITARVLAGLPKLRIVANYAVGYNNIDVAEAERRGIWVTNTPDVLTDATADLTMALILAVTRRVIEGDRRVRAGPTWRWRPDFLLGTELRGKVLGLVGYGRIARAVARRAAAFGLVVRYTRSGGPAQEDPSGYLPLADLLAAADILSVHVPLTPATRHLLGRRELALLKPGAYVINTARGEVVDEAALAEALAAGRIAGVGLDVFEREPEAHPLLLASDRAVLTPHIGSATVEARGRMADLVVDNLLAARAGQRPPCAVNRPAER